MQENDKLQTKRDTINEICTMRQRYLEDGDSAILPHLRRSSPLLDIEFIESLSKSERAGMDARTPMLSEFMQSECTSLKERERAAVNAHMTQGSVPPWFVDGRGLIPWWDDKDIQGPRYPKPARIAELYGSCIHCGEPTIGGINCNCDGEQGHRETERERSKHFELAAREKAFQRNDVTEIPKGFDNSKTRNSIPEVKLSNRFTPLADMVDQAAAES